MRCRLCGEMSWTGPPERCCLLLQLRERLRVVDELPEALPQPLVALCPGGKTSLAGVLAHRPAGWVVSGKPDRAVVCRCTSAQEHMHTEKTWDGATCQHQSVAD